MKISVIFANLIEKNGKKLYINDFSGKKEDFLVLSRPNTKNSTIKNAIRITTSEVANSMNLKKFLPISEREKISIGSFSIEGDFVSKKGWFNPIIDEKYYFFSEIPEIPILDYSKMILLFDTNNYFENEKEVLNFIKLSKFSEIVLSGENTDFWFNHFSKFAKKIKIINKDNQVNLF